MPHVSRTVAHVDLDCFYAAVEALEEPALAGRPVIVCGLGPRGVVSAASYEARCHGVVSAMPTITARRLCPQGVFVGGNRRLYADYSARFRVVLDSFTPLIDTLALDEAYMDVSGALGKWGSASRMGEAIRAAIWSEVGLAASVGLGTTRLVAKLASKAAKPTASPGGVLPGRQVVNVPEGETLGFLHAHPVGAVPGVGVATQRRLGRLGVATVGDLARVPREVLARELGRNGERLHDLAWAKGDSVVGAERAPQVLSQEETYPVDLYDQARIGSELSSLSDALAARLQHAGLASRTVSLKVRLGNFRTISRSHTFDQPTDSPSVITSEVTKLATRCNLDGGVRLLGVSVSNLSQGGTRQLTFDLEGAAGSRGRRDAASAALAVIGMRFGDRAIRRASSLEPPGPGAGRRVMD